MDSLASRKRDKKPELSESEKFIQSLQTSVTNLLTLHKAAALGHPKNIERLLEGKAGAADAIDTESGNPPLVLSAQHGHLSCVQVLIEKGVANLNLPGYGGLTALHHSCKQDHVEVTDYLLSKGAEVNAVDEAGNTPLALCARMGNLRCLELLVNKGAQIDVPNKAGMTAFLSAALNSRIAIIDFLLKKPINIYQADKEGNTALHIAAKCGYVRVVRHLLAAGFKTTITNELGQTAEEIATTDAVKQLLTPAA